MTESSMKRKALELFTEKEMKKVERFIPRPAMGRVCSVYDGDSITVIAYLGKDIYKFSVRINGVDTPEIRGKNDYEKELAQKAKKFVHDLCYDKIVTLKNHGKDKYGRVLADVYVDEAISVAKKLIKAGLAREYHGGTKLGWNGPGAS